MKIRSNVKSGAVQMNHNERTANDKSDAVAMNKTFEKKLRLGKETIREVSENDMKKVVGGRPIPTRSCLCTY